MVVNRDARRGADLVDLLNVQTPARGDLQVWRGTQGIPDGTDVLVNCTRVGLFPDVDARLDIDVKTLRPGMVVADVVPSPPNTNLIKDARAAGCTVLDGLGMLVNQGVISIKYWTGQDVDPAVMHAKLREIYGV